MLSDVIASQVVRLRKRAGLTQAGLADRCAEVGVPSLTYYVIGAIETGRPAKKGGTRTREVSVDAVGLALALDVPPVMLIADPRETDTVPVAAGTDLDPWEALMWLVGARTLPNGTGHGSFRAAAKLIEQGYLIEEMLTRLGRRERGFRRNEDGTLAHDEDGGLIPDPEQGRIETDQKHRDALETIRSALIKITELGAPLPKFNHAFLTRAKELDLDLDLIGVQP